MFSQCHNYLIYFALDNFSERFFQGNLDWAIYYWPPNLLSSSLTMTGEMCDLSVSSSSVEVPSRSFKGHFEESIYLNVLYIWGRTHWILSKKLLRWYCLHGICVPSTSVGWCLASTVASEMQSRSLWLARASGFQLWFSRKRGLFSEARRNTT